MKKRIHAVTLRVDSTSDFRINDRPVSFKKFGEAGTTTPLDAPPVIFTGDKKIMGFLGWDNQGQITITQNDPVPFRVLAIATEVSF